MFIIARSSGDSQISNVMQLVADRGRYLRVIFSAVVRKFRGVHGPGGRGADLWIDFRACMLAVLADRHLIRVRLCIFNEGVRIISASAGRRGPVHRSQIFN